jgi:hypothetical protein
MKTWLRVDSFQRFEAVSPVCLSNTMSADQQICGTVGLLRLVRWAAGAGLRFTDFVPDVWPRGTRVLDRFAL